MPKEHPILFSGPMVRALLAGTKTQTRRLRAPRWVSGDRLWVRETWCPVVHGSYEPWERTRKAPTANHQAFIQHRADGHGDEYDGFWRPSIFMPRWASRITLEVVRTWAEPLQDISEADAIAEGSQTPIPEMKPPMQACWSERQAYKQIWDSINGKKAPWESNPTVHATEFRVVSNG